MKLQIAEKQHRVLLVDDHPVVRHGMRSTFADVAEFTIVGEADNGEQAVKLATELRPDVVLMDIAMPKLNGIEATKQIKAICPASAVLILTAYDDDQYVFALLLGLLPSLASRREEGSPRETWF